MRWTLFSKLVSSLWGMSAGTASSTNGLSLSLSSELRPLLPPTQPAKRIAPVRHATVARKAPAAGRRTIRSSCFMVPSPRAPFYPDPQTKQSEAFATRSRSPPAFSPGFLGALALGFLRVLLGRRQGPHLGHAV